MKLLWIAVALAALPAHAQTSQVDLSRQLVTIQTDCDVPFSMFINGNGLEGQ